ncbi:MAG: MASE1 domain-containing protein [Burkholderiales bacterium]|nr:MASE1 domain-containing protein [Burkholderiales bacterium]
MTRPAGAPRENAAAPVSAPARLAPRAADAGVAVALVAGYVALDWASYIHPLHGLNITPWSPAPALALVVLLRHGARMLAPCALAILLADALVRELPVTVPVLAIGLVPALAYWLIAGALRRRLRGVEVFADRGALLAWAGIVALGTLGCALAFISLLTVAGLVPAPGWREAAVRYWVGDLVGILVTMPVLWMLASERARRQLRAVVAQPESLVVLAAIAAALWLAFGLGAGTDFRFLYVLCLPIVWAAARSGLAGAVMAAALVQVGIIGGVLWRGLPAASVLEIQVLALVLALIGFLVGIVVDERQRIGEELRQTLRLAAAGEMAAALAHELNQPLTALSAYGTACERMLAAGDGGERLREAVQRMVAESQRAALVVRRLRDFFRTGATRLERVGLGELVAAAAAPFVRSAPDRGVAFDVADAPPVSLLVDRLQLEVVLRNLIQNAFDAVADRPEGERRVRLEARLERADRLAIDVRDSGPGIGGAGAAGLFEPFVSTKSTGLGLGLVISRAIVEAHGGRLWAEDGPGGIFHLTLPAEAGA